MSVCSNLRKGQKMSPSGGLEPPTLRLTVERASQLRHEGSVDYALYADSIFRLIPGLVWFKATPKTSCTWPNRPSWPDLAAQRRTMGFWLLQPSEVKLLRFFFFQNVLNILINFHENLKTNFFLKNRCP